MVCESEGGYVLQKLREKKLQTLFIGAYFFCIKTTGCVVVWCSNKQHKKHNA